METNSLETKETTALKHSPQFLRKRKFLVVLPLMVLPCLAAIFASFGGGKGNTNTAAASDRKEGLNSQLPDARFKHSKEKDKLEAYEEASKDSERILSARRKDPYFKNDSNLFAKKPTELQRLFESAASKYGQKTTGQLNTIAGTEGPDANSQKVMDKLAQLKSALAQNANRSAPYDKKNPGNGDGVADNDISKLGELMKRMQNKSAASDPELNQIGGLLDKLIDVQHPERLADSMRALAAKSRPLAFQVFANDHGQPKNENGFYGPSQEANDTVVAENAILAVVEGSQTLVSGATLKLRLLQNIYVHGNMIPKDALIAGLTSLSGERLKITVTSIRNQENLFPVSLEAYDMDGLAGIYVPGSIDRDVSKQSADEAIGAIGLTTLDPSIGAQAASAGIQAAKTLISKKVKLVRVSVQSGYTVLLKDISQH